MKNIYLHLCYFSEYVEDQQVKIIRFEFFKDFNIADAIISSIK